MTSASHIVDTQTCSSQTFVYPPVSVSKPGSTDTKQVSGADLLKYLLTQSCVYIRGQERAGKTSLLKTLYVDITKTSSRIPLLLSGEALAAKHDESIVSPLRSAIRAQYGPEAIEPFEQMSSERKIILVDDFHKHRSGAASKHKLLHLLKAEADLVIVTSTDMPGLEDYGADTTTHQEPAFSALVSIRELPPSSRAESPTNSYA